MLWFSLLLASVVTCAAAPPWALVDADVRSRSVIATRLTQELADYQPVSVLDRSFVFGLSEFQDEEPTPATGERVARAARLPADGAAKTRIQQDPSVAWAVPIAAVGNPCLYQDPVGSTALAPVDSFGQPVLMVPANAATIQQAGGSYHRVATTGQVPCQACCPPPDHRGVWRGRLGRGWRGWR